MSDGRIHNFSLEAHFLTAVNMCSWQRKFQSPVRRLGKYSGNPNSFVEKGMIISREVSYCR